MKLIQKLKTIDDIDFGDKTLVEQNCLSVNAGEIESFLKSKIEPSECA